MIQQFRNILKPVQLTALAAGLVAVLACAPAGRAAEASALAAKPAASAAEADAWTATKESAKPPTVPDAWRTTQPTKEEQKEYMDKAMASAGKTADLVAEFVAKFPTSSHNKEARRLQLSALQLASRDNPARAAEYKQVLAKSATDTSLIENDRISARLMLLQANARKGESEAEKIKATTETYLAIQKDFPTNQQFYVQMLRYAEENQGAETSRLVKVVAGSAGAPEKLKKKAQDMLDGKVFSASANIGKPVAIKFTAVDGTEVDLAKMKGKVVLVDFWATWCGPCVAEIPHVKAAYKKYHDKGFEIIGISFDREGDKEKLIKFTQTKGMPWAQYFDGKYWQNDFGAQFNIHSIPAMWLIGKNGNLADVNAREDLDGKVGKMLEAN